jgi:hypothetical protein
MSRFGFVYVASARLTGVCATCGRRVKVYRDGRLFRHRPTKDSDYCPGSGGPAGDVVRKKGKGKGSVRTVAGGAFESDRRRH